MRYALLALALVACGASSTPTSTGDDDITDEDVFRLRRPDVLSIRIEHAEHSAAELHVPHPGDIVPLLDELVSRLRASGASNWLQDNAACSA